MLAQEIADDLQTALEQFSAISAELKGWSEEYVVFDLRRSAAQHKRDC